jgi:hypothetical protein
MDCKKCCLCNGKGFYLMIFKNPKGMIKEKVSCYLHHHIVLSGLSKDYDYIKREIIFKA